MKDLEVVVIGVHGNSGFGALEIVAPMLKYGNDGEEFLIVGVIVAFRGGEFPRPECHGVGFLGYEGFLGNDAG
jgi:hypothetical protein